MPVVCSEPVCTVDSGAEGGREAMRSSDHGGATPRPRGGRETARPCPQHHDQSARRLGQRRSRVRYVAEFIEVLLSNVQL